MWVTSGLLPLPILTVMWSPRCVAGTGPGEAAVRPGFRPDPLSAGFLRPEGSPWPAPGRPSSPRPLSARSFWDAPWLRASVFLERPPALAPRQALGLQRDILGTRWAQPAVGGGQRVLLASGTRGSVSCLASSPRPLSESPGSGSGDPEPG